MATGNRSSSLCSDDAPEKGEPAARQSYGFTLIELMVVITIVALASAAVVLGLPDGKGELRREAAIFAARAEAARGAAVVGSRPTRLVINDTGYSVEQRRDGEWTAWQGKEGSRRWAEGTQVASTGVIAFDAAGLGDPALLSLSRGGASLRVRVDADGSVHVEG